MNGYRLSVEADDGETFLVNHVIQKRMAIEDVATGPKTSIQAMLAYLDWTLR